MIHAYRRIVCTHCGATIDVPVFCGDRFCPVCSVTRLIRVRKRMEWLIAQQPAVTGCKWQMWTFSTRNCEDLTAGIKQLQKSFRKLRNTQYWKNQVIGGVFVIEIKGRPGNWHPHVHCIIYTHYLKWDAVFKLWRRASGGRAVYYTDIKSAVATKYITKYCSKPDMPDDCAEIVSRALKGIRLFSPIGSFHSISKGYKKPTAPCKGCGHTAWADNDVFEGRFPELKFMEFIIHARYNVTSK